MAREFTAVFERDGEWWVGSVLELPGANTQGATIEEARENLNEAIELILEAHREDAQRACEGHEVVLETIAIPA